MPFPVSVKAIIKKQPVCIVLIVAVAIAFLLKHIHVACIKTQAIAYFLFDTDKKPVLVKCIKHYILSKLQ